MRGGVTIAEGDVAARTCGSKRRRRSEVCSPLHSQSLWGFAVEQSEARRSEKTPKSLAARTGSVGSTHQQGLGAGMFAPQVCDLRVIGSDRQQENDSRGNQTLGSSPFHDLMHESFMS